MRRLLIVAAVVVALGLFPVRAGAMRESSCKSDPKAGVEDPDDLEVRDPCARGSGTVVQVEKMPEGVEITLKPDPGSEKYTRGHPDGTFTAVIVPDDQDQLRAPSRQESDFWASAGRPTQDPPVPVRSSASRLPFSPPCPRWRCPWMN